MTCMQNETGKSVAPTMIPNNIKTYVPLVVINCSKQVESKKSSILDLRLKLESDNPFAVNTTAYCLVLRDVMFQYTPLPSVMHRVA